MSKMKGTVNSPSKTTDQLKGRETISSKDLLTDRQVKVFEKDVPLLIKGLKSKDENWRWDVVWALGEIGDDKALPALRKVLEKDPSSSVREAAQEAIQKIRMRNEVEIN
jgi:hypothetical protein